MQNVWVSMSHSASWLCVLHMQCGSIICSVMCLHGAHAIYRAHALYRALYIQLLHSSVFINISRQSAYVYCYVRQAVLCFNCIGDKCVLLTKCMSTALTQLPIIRFP